jgi:hypothetical protein
MKMNRVQKFVRYFWGTIVSPRKSFQRIQDEESILVGLTPVIILGFLAGITYFVSYLYGASVTMEELYAGKFGVEPLISIPKETYRLWEAFFILPMYIVSWILLSGFAYLGARAFGVKESFKKDLNVLGFAYFVPLYFFVVIDFFLIGPAYSWNLAAARGLHGTAIQTFATISGFLYVGIPFGVWAPILTVIHIKRTKRLSLWKAVVVAVFALIPPYALFTIFIR